MIDANRSTIIIGSKVLFKLVRILGSEFRDHAIEDEDLKLLKPYSQSNPSQVIVRSLLASEILERFRGCRSFGANLLTWAALAVTASVKHAW